VFPIGRDGGRWVERFRPICREAAPIGKNQLANRLLNAARCCSTLAATAHAPGHAWASRPRICAAELIRHRYFGASPGLFYCSSDAFFPNSSALRFDPHGVKRPDREFAAR